MDTIKAIKEASKLLKEHGAHAPFTARMTRSTYDRLRKHIEAQEPCAIKETATGQSMLYGTLIEIIPDEDQGEINVPYRKNRGPIDEPRNS